MMQNSRHPEDARPRLQEIRTKEDLLPWRRADSLEACALYWLPVKPPPAPKGQIQWQIEFYDRLTARLAKDRDLRPESFMQMLTLQDYAMDDFLRNAQKLNPVMGLSRKPDAPLPKLPTMDDIRPMQQNQGGFRMGDWMPDYSYWFTGKQERFQRELFFGYGGMTTLFLAPDPNTEPPEVKVPAAISQHPVMKRWFGEDFDPAAVHRQSYALIDEFLEKSVKCFGAGLEDDPQYPGLLYVLPRLTTTDFFSAKPEAVAQWFEVFDGYLTESPADKGALLALKEDSDETLIEILLEMREEGWVYPDA